MISINQGEWEFLVEDGNLPSIYTSYLEHANFADEIDIRKSEGRFFFLCISKRGDNQGWPSVVLAQKYHDAQQTWHPGFLFVPRTSLLFIGAGERLLCYDIEKKKRLWEDVADCGFWRWCHYDNYVLMSAESEFGAWDEYGNKLWSTFVEPPWSFELAETTAEIDVMGELRTHQLSDGKQII